MCHITTWHSPRSTWYESLLMIINACLFQVTGKMSQGQEFHRAMAAQDARVGYHDSDAKHPIGSV